MNCTARMLSRGIEGCSTCLWPPPQVAAELGAAVCWAQGVFSLRSRQPGGRAGPGRAGAAQEDPPPQPQPPRLEPEQEQQQACSNACTPPPSSL